LEADTRKLKESLQVRTALWPCTLFCGTPCVLRNQTDTSLNITVTSLPLIVLVSALFRYNATVPVFGDKVRGFAPTRHNSACSVTLLLIARTRCYCPLLLGCVVNVPSAVKLQMVLDKSATDDQLLDALRDEMGRLKAQLQQAHQHQAQLQAAAASGMR
jgi:TRAP-type mannitol/chloroaromatic compound transport system permease large subunit